MMAATGTGFRVGFCVSGGGRLFRAAVAQSERLGITPVVLVADHGAEADLESFCTQHAIPCVRLQRMPAPAFADMITPLAIDAQLDLLCLTFNRIIPPALVSHYRGRIINVHMSLLPAFKGLRGLEQALTADVRFVGVTIHEVDEGVDTGPIIAQTLVGVRPDDTAPALGDRLFPMLRAMYLQVIAWYVQGRVEKDANGHMRVRGATYGELPVSPSIELTF